MSEMQNLASEKKKKKKNQKLEIQKNPAMKSLGEG
jgi:hypothetical protein